MTRAACGLVALCATVAVAGSAAHAQTAQRIQTDRPSLSSNANTVLPGDVQIEAGGQYSRTSIGGQAADREFSLDVTLRVGVTSHMELRLEGSPLVVLRGEQDDTGIGDVALEAKYRFLDAREDWPSFGVLPFVRFQTAHAPHGTKSPDFGLIGLASFGWAAKLGLDVNAGVAGISQRPGGYIAQGMVSAALSRDLGERWLVYGEIFWFSPAERGAGSSVGFDAGVQFFVTQYLALDAAGQTSLVGPGPDYAFRAGLSVRFGR